MSGDVETPRARDARTATISVRLPASVRAAAERAAEADTRSLNSLMEKVLKEYLRRKGFLPPASRR